MELGQQIDHLLQENHSLMQMKMSLGLEVATYRYAALKAEDSGVLKHSWLKTLKASES